MGPEHDKRRVRAVYEDVVKYLREKHGLMNPSGFMAKWAQREPFEILEKAIDEIVYNQECAEW